MEQGKNVESKRVRDVGDNLIAAYMSMIVQDDSILYFSLPVG